MAEVAPVSGVMDLAPIADQSFILTRRDQYSRSAGGSVYAAELGGPVWKASYTTMPMPHRRAMALEAKLNALRGSIVPFVSWDFRAEFPAAYPDGQWPGNVVGEVSAKGDMLTKTFTRKGATVNADGAMFVTRSGTATVFDADGLIKTVAANNPRFAYDPSEINLTWPSENLTSTQWTATRFVPTLAHVWNGRQFTRLTPNTATQVSHQITNNRTFAAVPFRRECTHSMVVASDGPTTTRLALRCWDTQGFLGFVYYNLEAGTSFPTSLISTTIEDLGEGYWRITATHAIREGTTTSGNQIYAANPAGNNTTNYDFNGIDGYFVSECQFEISVLPTSTFTSYKKTTTGPSAKPLGLMSEPTARTNLCLQSGNLMASPWTVGNGVLRQPTTFLAPDGSTFATAVGPPATASQSYLYQFFTFPGIGQRVSIRIFGCYWAWRYYQLWMPGGATGTSSRYVNIDLVDRVAVSSLASAVSVKTKLLPDGWMMIDSTWLMEGDGTAGGTSGQPGILIAPANSMSDTRRPTVTGDGTSMSYFWGGQHEAGGVEIGSYIPTTTTSVTRGAESVSLYNDGGNNWTLNADPALAPRHATGALNIAGYAGFIKGYEAKLSDPVQGLPGVTMTGIGIDNDRITLSGLPRGFIVTEGDYFSFDYGAKPYRYLGQIIETKVASAAGVINDVLVYPPIPTTAVFGLTVNLVRASAFFRIEPGSLKHSIQGGAFTSVSFDAVQSF